MGNLAEVVNLHALADDGGFHLGPVNGRSRSDFHVVPDDHIAQVLDFLPGTVRLRGVAEAIGTDDGIGMDDHVVTDDHARVDHHARINDTMLSDMGIVPDIDILKNLRKIPHRGMMAHIGVAAQIHFPAEFGRQEPGRPETAVTAVGTLGRGHVFQQGGQGGIGIVYPHHRGVHSLLGFKILVHQQDRSLAGVNELFVFRVGIKTELTGFSVLNFCERGHLGTLVAIDRSFEYLS